MKTYDEIISALPEEEKAILVSEREAALKAEKDKGIAAATQARNNVSKILSSKEKIDAALKEIGVDPESETAIDAIKELKKPKQGGKQDPEWKAELEKRDKVIEALNSKYTKAEEKNAKLRKSQAISKIEAKLKGRYFNHVDAAEMMIIRGNVVIKEDESLAYMYNGEEIDLDKGINQFIEDHPENAINTSSNGGGSSGGNGGGSKNKQMAQADWLKLDPKERASFMMAGGKLT